MACCIRAASPLLSWQVTLIVAVTGTDVEAVDAGGEAAGLAGWITHATANPTHPATISPATISGQRRMAGAAGGLRWCDRPSAYATAG